jgi:hypothetical protein
VKRNIVIARSEARGVVVMKLGIWRR